MRVAALLATLTACGAGDSTGAAADAGPPPTLLLGTGDATFTPLTDGGVITAFMGPQGGFHVYLTLRATGVDPGNFSVAPGVCSTMTADPCISFVVSDLTGATATTLSTFVPLRLPLTGIAADVYELQPSRQVQLAIGSLADVDGHRLRITSTIDDAHGAHAATTLEETAIRFDRPDAGP